MYADQPQIPLGKGINQGMSEDMLSPGEVAGALNFLFFKGEARTRPGRDTVSVTGANTGIIFARSLSQDTEVPLTVACSNDNKLYSLSSANALTEITGAGITYGNVAFFNTEMVNGVVMLGNHPAGILRWDPTGGTYSVISDARFRYVTAHLSRAVGAYKLSGSAGDPRTVGYSITGDETDWTSDGSGSTLLVDAPDEITGLFVIKNLLVICRRGGFHLGYPTGISLPPFRFEAWNRQGIGVYYPSTLAYTDNISLFVGEDDVYTNDLSSITPIGYKIRDELLRYLKSGLVLYQGFITRHYTGQVRLQYHLFPSKSFTGSSPAVSTVFPHFVYDMYEDTWSTCSYEDGLQLRTGFYRISTTSSKTLAMFNTSGNLRHWDDSLACDAGAYLITPSVAINDLSRDSRLSSVMLKYRDQGEIAQGGVKITATVVGQDDVYRSAEATHAIGTSSASERWMRARFITELNGQIASFRLETQPGVRLRTNMLIPKVQDSGPFKGTL